MVAFSDLVGLAASALATLQRPLIEVAEKTYGIPLIATPTMLEDWVHFEATIGIGTSPGQLLRAIIDINAAGTYIESTKCHEMRWCCPADYWQYNHTLSSSYRPNDTAVDFLYMGSGPEVNGTLSYDTLRLKDDLEIPDHVFIETMERYSRLPVQWDTVLSLSPSRLHYRDRELKTNISIPSVFEELVNLNAVNNRQNRNLFSLLSPYQPGHLGDLSFGTHHEDLYEGELIKHPLYPPGADTWQIKAPDVKLRSKDGEVLYEKPNDGRHVAHLDTTSPGIYFPIGSNITEHIGGHGIDQSCAPDALDQLPDIVLDFDGQEVVLTARDYFVQAHDLWGTFRCRLMVAEADYVDTRGNDAITLGTDFLKMVYAVFDWDERSISFAKPRRDIELPMAQVVQRPSYDGSTTFPKSCFDWR